MNWHELFSYSHDGHLVWKVRPQSHFKTARSCNSWNAMFAGKPAGATLKYVMVKVWGKAVQAHRIIWEMHHGPIPRGYEIDHINRVKTDNRKENLRIATRSQNCVNLIDRGASNKTGYIGVYQCGNKWHARISIEGKRTHIGSFSTPEEAHEAYRRARKSHHGEFSPLSDL